ncbi:hypothetical protein XFLM_07995 [Xylella fastidiosa subsp. fastidiosa GB514]|nr:hypothetical protein XFLM_07995 [Xylella fastidiosa subsp. fastidiosa GB514]
MVMRALRTSPDAVHIMRIGQPSEHDATSLRSGFFSSIAAWCAAVGIFYNRHAYTHTSHAAPCST